MVVLPVPPCYSPPPPPPVQPPTQQPSPSLFPPLTPFYHHPSPSSPFPPPPLPPLLPSFPSLSTLPPFFHRSFYNIRLIRSRGAILTLFWNTIIFGYFGTLYSAIGRHTLRGRLQPYASEIVNAYVGEINIVPSNLHAVIEK